MNHTHEGHIELPILDQAAPLHDVRQEAIDTWNATLKSVGARPVGRPLTHITHGEHPRITVSGHATTNTAGIIQLDTHKATL